MKEVSILSRNPELKPHPHMLFIVIHRAPYFFGWDGVEVLPHCRGYSHFIFIIKGFRTIVFIFIVISTTFRPICPLAFFRCLSNSGTYAELRTTSFIESTRVACSGLFFYGPPSSMPYQLLNPTLFYTPSSSIPHYLLCPTIYNAPPYMPHPHLVYKLFILVHFFVSL